MTKSKVVEELWAALIQSTRIWRGPFWSYPSVPSSQLHPQQPPQSQAPPYLSAWLFRGVPPDTPAPDWLCIQQASGPGSAHHPQQQRPATERAGRLTWTTCINFNQSRHQ